jgi:hypothetical protein
MTYLKLRGVIQGGHVHVDVRVHHSPTGLSADDVKDRTFALAGHLVVRLDEWDDLRRGDGIFNYSEPKDE